MRLAHRFQDHLATLGLGEPRLLAQLGLGVACGFLGAAKDLAGLARGLAMDVELPAAYCAMDVSEVLDRGRRFSPEVAHREITAVNPAQVRRIAAEMLRQPSFQPQKAPSGSSCTRASGS